MRITDHPVFGKLEQVPPVTFTYNEITYEGRPGEPIAAALLANGVRDLRQSPVDDERRGIYCGIGHCYECRIWLNNELQVRACITPVVEQGIYSSERVVVDED